VVQVIAIRLGEELFCLDILQVREIARTAEFAVTSVPHARPYVEGVANLRGKVGEIAPHEGRIFPVDDSGVARKQLSLRLKAAGYEIIEANNGQDGLDKLQALTQGKDVLDVIQLVVYDVEMPIMDGYSMTAKIKGDERLGVLPVIMHSSLAGEANFRKGT
jgi:CheY-like chemotaxis protein